MQNRWMRFVKGCVEVRLHGDYVERFFNMCRTHDIELWNIRRDENTYSCHVASSDFSEMLPLMRKTGTKVKVLHKNGFPFYLPFLKKRILFFVGVCICLTMLYLVTDYVWAIEYVGNMQVSDDELTDFLKEEGISYGMKKKQLDCEEKEKKLRTAFPNVTWTSIYFEGTKLYVEIKENEKAEPVKQETQGMDMVATEDGTIVSIITRNGIPKVKIGDTVEKGQLLVAGDVPVYDEGQNVIDYQIYQADADIRIRTPITYYEKLGETYSVIVYTGKNKKGVFAEIPGLYFESPMLLNRKAAYEVLREKKQIKLLDNLYLPVFYGTIKKREYHLQYLTYTQEEMQQILSEHFEKFILCLQEKGVQIIEKNVKMVKNRKSMEINADILVIKPTGEKTVIRQE